MLMQCGALTSFTEQTTYRPDCYIIYENTLFYMKHIPAFILFLFTGTTLCAQLSVGPSVSANLTFWDWNIEPLGNLDLDPVLNYRLAVPVVYTLSNRVDLRAEAAYARRTQGNFEVTDENGNNAVKANITYQYWEGSLLGAVRPFSRMRSLYLLGGATVGRLTDSAIFDAKGKSASELGVDRKIPNDFDQFNKTNWMADIGLGSSKRIGPKGSLFIEMRVQKNLKNAIKSDLASIDYTTFLLSVGYLHHFVKAKT